MEVHQDVFLAILQRWHRYDGEVQWRHYLYRMTIRKALHQAKAMRKAKPIESMEQGLAAKDRPEASLVAQELQQRLMEHLNKLPARQAEVFILHRLEGLSYQAIAWGLSWAASTGRAPRCRVPRPRDRNSSRGCCGGERFGCPRCGKRKGVAGLPGNALPPGRRRTDRECRGRVE